MNKRAENVLEEVFRSLDDVLGDTDPNIPEDSSDDELRDAEPLVWCCQQIRKLIDDYGIVDMRELARWQDQIRALVIEMSGASPNDIDGSGCDSGDPLDLTLSEISQGFAHVDDKRPYWMWQAMIEHISAVAKGCERGAPRCADSGDCITEWCVPCAAQAYMQACKQHDSN